MFNKKQWNINAVRPSSSSFPFQGKFVCVFVNRAAYIWQTFLKKIEKTYWRQTFSNIIKLNSLFYNVTIYLLKVKLVERFSSVKKYIFSKSFILVEKM